MVIRAWLEDGTAAELRARLISIDDVDRGEETVAWAASTEEVCRAVRDWLGSLTSGRDRAG